MIVLVFLFVFVVFILMVWNKFDIFFKIYFNKSMRLLIIYDRKWDEF